MTDETKAGTIVGYWLERPDVGRSVRLFAGSTADEVAATVHSELDDDYYEGLPAAERGPITLVPFETTQEEIDALPEFEGW